jgi:hypothetical protein
MAHWLDIRVAATCAKCNAAIEPGAKALWSPRRYLCETCGKEAALDEGLEARPRCRLPLQQTEAAEAVARRPQTRSTPLPRPSASLKRG